MAQVTVFFIMVVGTSQKIPIFLKSVLLFKLVFALRNKFYQWECNYTSIYNIKHRNAKVSGYIRKNLLYCEFNQYCIKLIFIFIGIYVVGNLGHYNLPMESRDYQIRGSFGELHSVLSQRYTCSQSKLHKWKARNNSHSMVTLLLNK